MKSSLTNSKALLLIGVMLSMPRPARADAPAVPLQLQVDLAAKIVEYAQTPAPQAAGTIRIGILVKPGSVESAHFGAELKVALERAKIAGLPHTETLVTWSNPAALAAEIKKSQLFALYVTPGMQSEIPQIARALEGMQVITIASNDSYVQFGIILGFELISGRPRMLFNMPQSKKQTVTFRAAVMKLMRLVD